MSIPLVKRAHPDHAPRHLRAVPAPRAAVRAIPPRSPIGHEAPQPSPALMQKLALFAFEALEGVRSVSQLGAWVTPEVARQLAVRRAARTERRTVYHDERRVVARPGPVHLGRPARNVVEAAVVLHSSTRAYAVALRLEYAAGRWRATELTVL